MAGHRVSTTIDEETLKLARELAEWRGMSLSAWVARAARREAFFDRRVRDLGEYVQDFAPFTEEERRRQDAILDSIGMPRPPE